MCLLNSNTGSPAPAPGTWNLLLLLVPSLLGRRVPACLCPQFLPLPPFAHPAGLTHSELLKCSSLPRVVAAQTCNPRARRVKAGAVSSRTTVSQSNACDNTWRTAVQSSRCTAVCPSTLGCIREKAAGEEERGFRTHSQYLGHLSRTHSINFSAPELHDSPVPMGSILIQTVPSPFDGRLMSQNKYKVGNDADRYLMSASASMCANVCRHTHMPAVSLTPMCSRTHTTPSRSVSCLSQ